MAVAMNPPRKPVVSCQDWCLKSLETFSEAFIKNVTTFYTSGDLLIYKDPAVLEKCIAQYRTYLFHSIPVNLCSVVSKSFLQALMSWLGQTNFSSNDPQSELNDSVYIGLRLAEIVAHEKIQDLDLSKVPKQIRSCLYR